MISKILATPADFEGERVLVKGTAVGVCAKRGCWVELASDKEFQSIRVKVTDGEIVFPLSCEGKEVTVEGLVEKIEVSEEYHKQMAAAEAKKAGEEFDPATVTGPGYIWRIRGLGAKIES